MEKQLKKWKRNLIHGIILFIVCLFIILNKGWQNMELDMRIIIPIIMILCPVLSYESYKQIKRIEAEIKNEEDNPPKE